MKEQENLPITQKDKSIMISSEKSRKISDFLSRSGKVLKGLGLATAGLTLSAALSTVGVPVVPAVLIAGSVFSGAKGLSEIIYKTEPGIMFTTSKSKDGTREIWQNSLEFPSYLRGINISDKACIMGLQTLVGMQRYKNDLKSSGAKTIESNGKRVYEQKYATITHSININNLKALEEAGYIDIVSSEDEFHHNQVEAALGIKPRPLKSLLIVEKIGFSNTEGLKEIFKVAKSRDKQKLDELKQDFKKITFRLTDKDMDFEDIYKKVNGYVEFENPDEKNKLKRLRAIFYDSNSRIPGVLSGKRIERKDKGYDIKSRENKINIEYDKFGRPILKYNAKESFGERIEREHKLEVAKEMELQKAKKFEDFLKKGVSNPVIVKNEQRKSANTHEKYNSVNKDTSEKELEL